MHVALGELADVDGVPNKKLNEFLVSIAYFLGIHISYLLITRQALLEHCSHENGGSEEWVIVMQF